MPLVTMSLVPVTVVLDSKESGVTKVTYRGQCPGGGGMGPITGGFRECSPEQLGFYDATFHS